MSHKVAQTIAKAIDALEAIEQEHSTLAQKPHNSLQQAGRHAGIVKEASRFRGLLAGIWQRSIKDLNHLQAHVQHLPEIHAIIKEVKACKVEAKARKQREAHLAFFGLEERARLRA